MMRVLVVGSGGRDHALAWAIAASPLLSKLFIAPGNAGTARLGTNVPIAADDVAGLAAFARTNAIDLVVPGPEAPLVAGIADHLAVHGIACAGPSQAAARLEGSKRFTKEICREAGIPTAAWASFTDIGQARAYVRARGVPIVLKADGLAAGKGVVVARTPGEAEAAITAIMRDKIYGAAGAELLVESCLTGEEISVFALCDGEIARYFGAASDHKRAYDGDAGPNTGGMGAISPTPWATPTVIDAAMNRIIRPALAAMAARGTPFRGFLFAGLMVTEGGPQLIEFNARLGDPECETLLPLLRSDLLAALIAATDGRLADADLRWSDDASATVIMAARGYPGAFTKGSAIDGLERAGSLPGVTLFHAGTRDDGRVVRADGGRVLAVNATGADLPAALDRAYAAVEAIDWPDGFCRRDIGARARFGLT
jgi:phosphoribosylamine--glycine ligase